MQNQSEENPRIHKIIACLKNKGATGVEEYGKNLWIMRKVQQSLRIFFSKAEQL